MLAALTGTGSARAGPALAPTHTARLAPAAARARRHGHGSRTPPPPLPRVAAHARHHLSLLALAPRHTLASPAHCGTLEERTQLVRVAVRLVESSKLTSRDGSRRHWQLDRRRQSQPAGPAAPDRDPSVPTVSSPPPPLIARLIPCMLLTLSPQIPCNGADHRVNPLHHQASPRQTVKAHPAALPLLCSVVRLSSVLPIGHPHGARGYQLHIQLRLRDRHPSGAGTIFVALPAAPGST